MHFHTSKELLLKAQKKRYAVGAFNFQNMEVLQAIVTAANKEKAPVILQTSEGAITYAGLHYLVALARTALAESKVPMALHLDHGEDIELAKKCIRLGYSSIMIDASAYNFDKNVSITKHVVAFAHKHNVSVEAELGRLKGIEDLISVKDKEAILTDPEQAREFVHKTGCDALAIALGTSHGAYKFKGKSKLDFTRLKQIKEIVKIPLVLHGASSVYQQTVKRAMKYKAVLKGAHGVQDRDIRRAVRLGICKINTDTDIRLELIARLRKIIFTQPEIYDIRKLLGPARESMYEIVRKKIQLYGSSGKA